MKEETTLRAYILNNKEVVNTLVRAGVISTSLINNLGIYEFFLDNMEVGRSKSLSIQLTVERYKISQKTVYQIINQFSETV